MPKQIPFALPVEPAMDEEDFLITSSNADAAERVKQAKPAELLLLLGPKSSGKSHLARIWTARMNARTFDFPNMEPDALKEAPSWVLEDADKIEWNAENARKAFHLLNSAREQKRALLITASTPPASWKLDLADLRSRLLALHVAQLQTPDDALMAGLLVKHLNDRQLRVSEEVLNYLIPRLPREGAKIQEVVRVLDEASLADRRSITIPLLKEILQDTQEFEF
jgi:DnaA regulatory inactivator Hda